MTVYIPENLNLRELMKTHGLESEIPYIDDYHKIVGIVYEKWLEMVVKAERDGTPTRRFANLKAAYLRDAVSRENFVRIKKNLRTMDILQCNDSCVRGKRSYGFRLGDSYCLSKPRRVFAADKRRKTNKKGRSSMEEVYGLGPHLQALTIDADRAVSEIEQLWEGKAMNEGKCIYSRMHIDKMAHGDLYLYRDTTAGRVHSNLTNMPKMTRQHLKHPGGVLLELDVANAQPLLINCITSTRLSPYCVNSDLMLFRHLTESGEFYPYLMKKCEEHGAVYDNKDKFKIRFLTYVLYAENKPWYRTTEFNVFHRHFPIICELIVKAKEKDHKQLAIDMQKLEAHVMIDCICKRLAEEHPEVFVATIHDGLLVLEQHVDLVKGIALEEFAKEYGLRPTLKLKYPGGDLHETYGHPPAEISAPVQSPSPAEMVAV